MRAYYGVHLFSSEIIGFEEVGGGGEIGEGVPGEALSGQGDVCKSCGGKDLCVDGAVAAEKHDFGGWVLAAEVLSECEAGVDVAAGAAAGEEVASVRFVRTCGRLVGHLGLRDRGNRVVRR